MTLFNKFSHIRPVDAHKFPYPGGKANLRRFIIRWFPEVKGNIYMEPFVGRGNIYFLARIFYSYKKYVINDKQTHQFFNNMRDWKIRDLPVLSLDEISEFQKADPELFSLMEPMLTWAGGIAGKSSLEVSNRNLTTYKNRLIFGKQLLQDCEIDSMDAVDLLKYHPLDNQSFVYLDPPYLSGRVGIYKYNDFDRTTLIDILRHAKFKWLLSEYECDDMNEAFGRPCVYHYNVPLVLVGSHKAIMKTEVLYSNYLEGRLPNRLNFGDLVKPCKTSLNIFDHYDILTKNQFKNLTPSSWSKPNVNIEFSCLTKLPYAYWDGKKLYNLNLIKYWNQTE